MERLLLPEQVRLISILIFLPNTCGESTNKRIKQYPPILIKLHMI
jgi:hypothetical protein